MFLSVLSPNRVFVMKLVMLGGLLVSTILSSVVPVAESLLRLPEFAEPIKNVTLVEGSDVEFSCDVRYLGTYRVAWSWKKDEEQRLIGIGIVKITHNPRIHISRIQKSDDVTQFNLYIYNMKKEDGGTFHCSVNSNPMIEQIGTLDVTSNGNYDRDEQHKTKNDTVIIPPLYSNHTSDTNSTQLEEDSEGESNSSSEVTSDETKISQNSTLLCIDLNDVWENARERFSDFFSSLMKFTYSYWFS